MKINIFTNVMIIPPPPLYNVQNRLFFKILVLKTIKRSFRFKLVKIVRFLNKIKAYKFNFKEQSFTLHF